ncbi:E3 ubiquitin-protein ligase PUB23 [Acorus calamus]|uniref:U-box domain-containing protein n=1 Tax=Acorus calamus TaxID=4465 RepID=A0AAV9CA61_ACOCL|nr:E3 ubiquitin-protein ligase PUB23 [Acorus calamus]
MEEVPPFFICPISLHIMKDPVTVSTGVTYDRESIHRWISLYGHSTCPVTQQPLIDQTLTPNSTLLRLIQSWRAKNPSTSPLATQTPAFNVSAVIEELKEEANTRPPVVRFKSLPKIKALIGEDNAIRYELERAGAVSMVSSLVLQTQLNHDSRETIEDAINLLCMLKPSTEALKKVAEQNDGELIKALSAITSQHWNYRVKIEVTHLLKLVFKAVDEVHKSDLPSDLFDGLAEILKDQNSNRATTMAALSILLEVLPCGRKNRVRVVEAGTVAVLVELLAEGENNDRKRCEAMLVVLDCLCSRAEGRLALVSHPAGIAAVAGKLLKVSNAANDRATKVLLMVCRFCGVVEEMMVVGAVTRLCMLVQVGSNGKAKERAKEMLGLHVKTWSKSPCFPLHSIVL